MTQEPDGIVTEVGDGLFDLRFERRIARPIEKVWAALTTPERLEDWLAAAKLDLRLGGAIELTWATPGDSLKSTILAFDPPRVFAFGWPEPDGAPDSIVRFELSEAPGGCRLVLTNTLLRTEYLLSVAAGWHAHLNQLPGAAGRVGPHPLSAERWAAAAPNYKTLIELYRARLPREAAAVEVKV
jgi:uncharacterized protein YndB with AHSA1/START domain